MQFWTSFRLNWLEFNLLEHSFYSLSHISAHVGANYNKRIVAKFYSKIINIILIFRSAMAVVWDPVLLCFVFIIVTLGQKLRGCLNSSLATDEVNLSILVLPAQWYFKWYCPLLCSLSVQVVLMGRSVTKCCSWWKFWFFWWISGLQLDCRSGGREGSEFFWWFSRKVWRSSWVFQDQVDELHWTF